MQERIDNKKYSFKLEHLIFSNLYTILKNYNTFHATITIIFYSANCSARAIKQSIFRLYHGPFLAIFKGYFLFLKNISAALRQRKKIQAERVIKEDIFLKIKPPKI